MQETGIEGTISIRVTWICRFFAGGISIAAGMLPSCQSDKGERPAKAQPIVAKKRSMYSSSRFDNKKDGGVFGIDAFNTPYVAADKWVFGNNGRIEQLVLSSDKPWPGEKIKVEFFAENLGGARGVIGVLPTKRSSEQYVANENTSKRTLDPRERWHEVELNEGYNRVIIELAKPWYSRTGSIVLELHTNDGQSVEVLHGPRSEMLRNGERYPGGRAILAMLEIANSPVTFYASKVGDVEVDGKLHESVWQRRGALLVDSLHGEPVDLPLTEVWFAWNEQFLFLAASIDDQDMWSPFEQQDDPLYKGEAFELFVAADGSGRHYLEYEVSAKNVQFDARFSEYRKGDIEWDGQWKSAVKVEGTVDNPDDVDQGWKLELAVPWSEICENTRLVCPPQEGSQIRLNVFRLEDLNRRSKVGVALAPTRKPDFHAWQHSARLVLQP